MTTQEGKIIATSEAPDTSKEKKTMIILSKEGGNSDPTSKVDNAGSLQQGHCTENKCGNESSTKRPLSDLVQEHQSELPVADIYSTTTNNNNTRDTNRVRKKKRKKALQQQELILLFAKNSQFTNSVVLDLPNAARTNSSGSDYHHYLASTTTSCHSIRVITSTVLPTNVNKFFHVNDSINVIHVQPLLVLDLNGILCHRIRPHKEPEGVLSYRTTSSMHVANTHIIPRTNLEAFLTFLNTHFCLAVWTSAQQKTAKKLVQALFPESVSKDLLFCWGQNRCHAVQEEKQGVVVFEKQLDKVWNEFPLWNQFNTLLIDDSPDKCSSFRHNALHPPPLHGQQCPPTNIANLAEDHREKAWISDEENHSLQMEFFTELVQYWKDNPSETSWNEQGEMQCNKPSEAIWAFLQGKAMGHMGWKM